METTIILLLIGFGAGLYVRGRRAKTEYATQPHLQDTGTNRRKPLEPHLFRRSFLAAALSLIVAAVPAHADTACGFESEPRVLMKDGDPHEVDAYERTRALCYRDRPSLGEILAQLDAHLDRL